MGAFSLKIQDMFINFEINASIHHVWQIYNRIRMHIKLWLYRLAASVRC